MISFKHIVEAGLRKTDVYHTKRGILLSNYIALIFCGSVLILFLLRVLVLHNATLATFLYFTAGIALMLVTLLLNHFRYIRTSRVYICFMPVLFLWFVALIGFKSLPSRNPSDYDSILIYFLAMNCIPYLLLDRRQLPVFILGLLPVFISIFFFNSILEWAGASPASQGLNPQDFKFLQVRVITSYFFISACCAVFQEIILRNDQFNRRLVVELREKSNEIEAQNEELLQGQEALNDLNQHLERMVEERTMKIRSQNEILTKYAYTNAHHVRGPLARLLGLIQLSRMDTNLDYKWLFEHIETEAIQIDQVIKRISTELA